MFDGNIDIREFDNWLSKFDPAENVGGARLCFGCPIRNFILSTKGPIAALEVLEDQIYVKADAEAASAVHNLPLWAQHFIWWVDENGLKGDPISAGHARKVLAPLLERFAPVEYL